MCRPMSFFALIGISLVGAPIHVAGNESEEREPAVPADLKVPVGHKLLFKVEAKGVQIYKSVTGKGSTPEWSFDSPLADLFDSNGKKVGCHYEGPSWESSDGSKVKKPDEKGAVKLKEAPNPKEDIPWLLIKVKAEEGQKRRLPAWRLTSNESEQREASPPRTFRCGLALESASNTGPSTISTVLRIKGFQRPTESSCVSFRLEAIALSGHSSG
jgi:Protein of unknown function (DUF3455)